MHLNMNLAHRNVYSGYLNASYWKVWKFSVSVSEKGAPKPSMLALVHNIVTREGVAGLYRGISPNLLKVIPAVSVSYVVYEYTRMALGVDFEGRRGGKGNGWNMDKFWVAGNKHAPVWQQCMAWTPCLWRNMWFRNPKALTEEQCDILYWKCEEAIPACFDFTWAGSASDGMSVVCVWENLHSTNCINSNQLS